VREIQEASPHKRKENGLTKISALGYRSPEEFEHTVAPGNPPGAASMQFFEPAEGAESEREDGVKTTVRPTGVC